MASFLYPFAFLAALAALSGWFYNRDDERRSAFLRKLFLGSLTAFGASWLFGQGDFSYKIIVLGRELLVLAIVPFALSLFRRTRWAYFLMLGVTLLAMKKMYFHHLQTAFPQAQPSEVPAGSGVPLDKEGELLIEIKENHQLAEIQAVLKKFDLTATPAFSPKDKDFTDLDDYYVVNVPPKFEHDLGKVKKALEANAAVEYLEENEIVTLAPMPAEPMRKLPGINQKFGINDPGLELMWGFEAMKVDDAYKALQGVTPKKKALIAILDTGVEGSHEDLNANFVSTQTKYDYDKAGHGTHCAGIAAAVSNNGRGVASFSQNNDFVRVTSIKVLSDGGMGSQKMIIDGILEAADAGADVLSMSLGGLSNDSRQRAYTKAVQYVTRKGGILVAAAGNSNRNAKDFCPANTPGVISVSAVDTLLGRASFSNFIKDLKMGVAAPGVKIYSTVPGSQYRTMNGTSMATPYVSGLVGLMKSLRPELTTQQAFDILNKTGAETKNTGETGKLIQPGAVVREMLKK